MSGAAIKLILLLLPCTHARPQLACQSQLKSNPYLTYLPFHSMKLLLTISSNKKNLVNLKVFSIISNERATSFHNDGFNFLITIPNFSICGQGFFTIASMNKNRITRFLNKMPGQNAYKNIHAM